MSMSPGSATIGVSVLCACCSTGTCAGVPADCPLTFHNVPSGANGQACSGRGAAIYAQGTCQCYTGMLSMAFASVQPWNNQYQMMLAPDLGAASHTPCKLDAWHHVMLVYYAQDTSGTPARHVAMATRWQAACASAPWRASRQRLPWPASLPSCPQRPLLPPEGWLCQR